MKNITDKLFRRVARIMLVFVYVTSIITCFFPKIWPLLIPLTLEYFWAVIVNNANAYVSRVDFDNAMNEFDNNEDNELSKDE